MAVGPTLPPPRLLPYNPPAPDPRRTLMDISAARDCFPGTRDRAFLDAASVGLLPTQAEAALQQLVHDLVHVPARESGAHHLSLGQAAGSARREIARLIGGRSADVALVESTTHGLEILAAAIPLQHGDKVLVGETEYLGLAVPWLPKRETDGIIVDVVPSRGGRLLVDDFATAIDSRTRLILLSTVQWNNGFRCDLAAFCELARSQNVLLLVDTIQQLGAIGLDVGRTPVDFLVNGGHKWLNAPPELCRPAAAAAARLPQHRDAGRRLGRLLRQADHPRRPRVHLREGRSCV